MSKPAPLQHGQIYHIYNRGNNRQAVFVEDRNYRFFLKRYAETVAPIAETFAYCLLPNHFHLLLRIRDEEDLADLPPRMSRPSGPKPPSQYFSNFFNAYAKAINKAYGRTGAVFQRPFGRIPVLSDSYFVWLIAYIHQNPQKHGLVDDFRDWPYSSFQAILSKQPTRLARTAVVDWFGGVGEMVAFHPMQVPERRVAVLVPEDSD